jgi:hypothetical protein
MKPNCCKALLLLVLTAVGSFAFIPSTRSPQLPGRALQFLSMSEESTAESTKPPVPVKCPDCDLCDGSGRILGGIAVVFPWWPIKAYRPCPNFINRGGIYERSGQGLDEIAFGRDSTFRG